jgi:hypothetical protein
VWAALDGGADVVVEDDQSDPEAVGSALTSVASRSDVLLGPYSTQLMRAAGRLAAENDWLLWNHGGSGDDVVQAHPGHVISVLTPTSRYADPFLRRLADEQEGATLWIAQGKGSFGRQVAMGAEAQARRVGLDARRVAGDELLGADLRGAWDLFSAGTFEADIELITRVQALERPPRTICSVAAGVREFADKVADPEGIFGVGQWFPGAGNTPELGPSETDFLAACGHAHGTTPDYPAIQAVAAAVLAAHVAREVGNGPRDVVWATAAQLKTSTLFGAFGIHPVTGAQLKHTSTLVRWSSSGLALA